MCTLEYVIVLAESSRLRQNFWLSMLRLRNRWISTAQIIEYLQANLFVTDLMNLIVQTIRNELGQLRISAQEAGLMEPVEPWDEG